MTIGCALRRLGWWAMCLSVAFASSLGDSWAVTFLLGVLAFGAGVGLWDGPSLRDVLAGLAGRPLPPREG